MLLCLQGYGMTIVYRPSKEISLANNFSRLPNKKAKEAIDLDIKVDFIQFVQKLAQLHQGNNADSTLRELRDMILGGWPDAFKELDKNIGLIGMS